jgi:transposase InsO family protein
MVKLDLRNKRCIIRQLSRGVKANVLAKHYGVSKRHINRLRHVDFTNVAPVGRPRKIVEQSTRDLIVQLKKENQFGVHKLKFMLKRNHKIKLSDYYVHKVLVERNEITKQPEKGFRYKYIKFQRQHPNSMWQTDWKWLSDEECWLTAYLDDCSRFVVGSAKYTEATTDNTLELFHHAGEKHGYPKQILSDHGCQYWTKNGSRYTRELEHCGVEHIIGKIKKPTTTGKIERFWLTYVNEKHSNQTHQQFIKYYNYERQHQSLNYQPPAQIYLKQERTTK